MPGKWVMSKCTCDSKVSKTCLTILSDQDVALDVLSVNVVSLISSFCLPE
jgi:hypothetical protein